MTAGMSWDLRKSQESVSHVSVCSLQLTFRQQNMSSKSWLRIQFSLLCADVCNAHSSGENFMGTNGCEFFLSMYPSGLTFFTTCLCIFVSMPVLHELNNCKYLCLLLWHSCLWSVWSICINEGQAVWKGENYIIIRGLFRK